MDILGGMNNGGGELIHMKIYQNYIMLYKVMIQLFLKKKLQTIVQ